jgi:hypothetical protein
MWVFNGNNPLVTVSSLFPFYAGQPILPCLDEKPSNRYVVVLHSSKKIDKYRSAFRTNKCKKKKSLERKGRRMREINRKKEGEYEFFGEGKGEKEEERENAATSRGKE